MSESSDEEDYLKIDSVAIDYDQENGLIPRSEVADAIVNKVQQLSADIYGNGEMHTVILSNAEVTHMENRKHRRPRTYSSIFYKRCCTRRVPRLCVFYLLR